jgi:hypothetical protein
MSQPEVITSIQDAEPEAWKGEKRAEPTGEQTTLFRACKAVFDRQEAMHTFAGPKSGPAWTAATQAYHDAWTEFEAVFRQIKGEQ